VNAVVIGAENAHAAISPCSVDSGGLQGPSYPLTAAEANLAKHGGFRSLLAPNC
jgi:hypothetical protein